MSDVLKVDFYFTPSSRYSYLASTQLDAIAERTGCRFDWKPLNNHAILARFGADPFLSKDLSSGQYAWSYREEDATRWAALYGVPYVEPVNFRQDPPWLVRSCFAAELCGQLTAYCNRLFQAIFVESLALQEADLQVFAADVGIDVVEFNEAFTSQHINAQEQSVLDEAETRGVFGVPSFVLGDEMFWGNDRLILLEHALSRLPRTD